MLPIRNRSEQAAYEWLCGVKGIPQDELTHTHGSGRPDFVHITKSGKYGYEVKTLDCGCIKFERRQYNSFRRWLGEVLVFEEGESSPSVIIPFSELPQDGGLVYGIGIQLISSPKRYYTTIAIDMDEKDELERMRGEIETKTLPQGDWADVIHQAMCAMLCDIDLIRFSYADRMGVKHFIVCCPYCNTDNTIEGRYRLYWMLECSYCKRRFVAKRRVTKKTAADFLA